MMCLWKLLLSRQNLMSNLFTNSDEAINLPQHDPEQVLPKKVSMSESSTVSSSKFVHHDQKEESRKRPSSIAMLHTNESYNNDHALSHGYACHQYPVQATTTKTVNQPTYQNHRQEMQYGHTIIGNQPYYCTDQQHYNPRSLNNSMGNTTYDEPKNSQHNQNKY